MLKRASIEPVNDDPVINIEKSLPLDEKMSFYGKMGDFSKNDINNMSVEASTLETQWANFHRCKSRMTFMFQFIAVISVQGERSLPLIDHKKLH